jgi:hypothetical protein
MLFKVYTRGHVGRHASISRVKNDEAVPDGWPGYTRTHRQQRNQIIDCFSLSLLLLPGQPRHQSQPAAILFSPLPFSFISFG